MVGPRYLDPATGGYVIQMVIAGVLGAFYWMRELFRGKSEAPDPPPEEDESGELDSADEEAPS